MWLTHDPAYPDEQPTAPLARYTYTASGELRAVYDRSGTQVRGFTYDAEHAGRMVAHHYAGRPESRYRYDDTGRVTEQVNPEGLDYRFEYGEPGNHHGQPEPAGGAVHGRRGWPEAGGEEGACRREHHPQRV